MKRAFILAGFVIGAALCEDALLRLAATRDVSMSLLAGGGALPIPTLALAGSAMLVRLFVRLLLPGLVVQAALFWLLDRRRPGV
jgi:hypothetical protein